MNALKLAVWSREDTDGTLSPKSSFRSRADGPGCSVGVWFFGLVLGGALLICVVFAPHGGKGVAAPVAGGYAMTHSFVGNDFFEHWSFFHGIDPTHGTVHFLSYEESMARGLISAASDRVYMGVDATEVLSGWHGRKAVRIESKEWFKGGLFVLDLDHAPIACGAWPAFWMYGKDSQHAWPRWGEYDILEAVHNQTFATTTLHTRDHCDQTVVNHNLDFKGGPWSKNEKGGPAKNCFVKAPDEWNNQGCGQQQPRGSWGTELNQAGGGTWVAEWDPEKRYIRTWFFRRGQEPADLLRKDPMPSSWGLPTSFFTLDSQYCSPGHFQHMRLVFDITFCGDYGNPTFQPNCPSAGMSCKDYVQQKPHVFAEAYWSIRVLDIYRRPDEAPGVLRAPMGASFEAVPEKEEPNMARLAVGWISLCLGISCCAGVAYIMLNKKDETIAEQEIQGLSACMEDMREMDMETTVDGARHLLTTAYDRAYDVAYDAYENISQVAGAARPAATYPQRGPVQGEERPAAATAAAPGAMRSQPTRDLRNMGQQDRSNSGQLQPLTTWSTLFAPRAPASPGGQVGGSSPSYFQQQPGGWMTRRPSAQGWVMPSQSLR